MAEQSTMARPYAKAVFEIAQAEGSLGETRVDDHLAELSAIEDATIDELRRCRKDLVNRRRR